MARKNRSPEETACQEKTRELLQMANIGSMDDIQNLFKETIAKFIENGLEAELDEELGYSKYDYKNKDTDNSRNGHSSKMLCTSFGDVEVSVPRDRKGEFEPHVLKKSQTSISQDIEEKILSMHTKGMTTGDIEVHIQDIYGISVSDSTISRIIDKILPVTREWAAAAPGSHLRRGISGYHPLPCPQRGADREKGGLCCRRRAGRSGYPGYLWRALGQEIPENLSALAGQLGQPECLIQVPQEVCRLIYTINAIEGFNRQLRKVTKAKSVFPADDSLLKMLYLAMMDITKKSGPDGDRPGA